MRSGGDAPVDVLVIGWSDIVRRRVLPALSATAGVGQIHVCSSVAEPQGLDLRWHTDLGSALVESPGALVYVSGINTVHAPRIRAALESGHPVLADKPAVLDAVSATSLVALARERRLLLAEAVVWPYHPQVAVLRTAMAEQALVPSRLELTFTIPSLPSGNFRMRPAAGGGVVADMGAYALSPSAVLGLGRLRDVSGRVERDEATGLDTVLDLDAVCGGGVHVKGHFAIGEDYANRLILSGPGWTARLEPAFSSRPDASLLVHLDLGGDAVVLPAQPADTFSVALVHLLEDLREGRVDGWIDRTEASMADLLGLAEATGVVWPPPVAVG